MKDFQIRTEDPDGGYEEIVNCSTRSAAQRAYARRVRQAERRNEELHIELVEVLDQIHVVPSGL